MLNFEEELKKYKPSLEIDKAEDAIYQNDLRDVMDLIEEITKERGGRRPGQELKGAVDELSQM